MTVAISPADLEAAAQSLIRAERTNLGVEISLPVVYPTGQLVSVVVTVDGGDYVVHDAGFGAMCLTEAGARLTGELSVRLRDLARHYGCDFIDGRMSRRATAGQLALAVAMVANASRTVGDQALYVRHPHESEIRRQLSERLVETFGARVKLHEEIRGASGRRYRVANVILDESRRHPVAFIEALLNRNAIPAQFAEFYDLRAAHAAVRNEAVYDDSVGLKIEDRKLLDAVATLVTMDQAGRDLVRAH